MSDERFPYEQSGWSADSEVKAVRYGALERTALADAKELSV
jgi:hypothetical protein